MASDLQFDLGRRTILLTMAGSRAYGTSTSSSDFDVKGVCVPPSRYRLGFSRKFEQADGDSHVAGFRDLVPGCGETSKLEGTIYEIRKFFSLAADNNPNILDALFCDDSDVLLESPEGRLLRRERARFLSRKVMWTFSGYAVAQLKRIKTHRRYILERDRFAVEPTREMFGLPVMPTIPTSQRLEIESDVRKRIDSWELDLSDLDPSRRRHVIDQVARVATEMSIGADERWAISARSIGLEDDLVAVLADERRFSNAHDEWSKYQSWLRSRNPDRAALESQFGYDTKHAMHLVRLMRMCVETLETGEVRVRRPDAEELLEIRSGSWSYDRLIAWAEEAERVAREAHERSPLPRTPDRDALDALCAELTDAVESRLRAEGACG